MIPQFSPLEARVIGSLIEKQITTPEQYPLSLNALLLACNQKSNRDPVLELTDRTLQELIDALMRKHLVIEKSGFGSRVAKYQQRFCNTEFSVFQFTPQERAIVCELLLRGPQTPGELRSRAARMAEFADAAVAEQALEALAHRESGALVVRLAREQQKIERGDATLPSTIAEERLTNPFLRTGEASIQVAASRHAGRPLPDRVAVFAEIRAWKNSFR